MHVCLSMCGNIFKTTLKYEYNIYQQHCEETEDLILSCAEGLGG